MLAKIKNDWKFYTILTITVLIIMLLMSYMVNISDKLYKKVSVDDSDNYIEEITTDTIICQKFIAEKNNLEKIYISFEPLKNDKLVGGNVIVGIKDEYGNVIKENEITKNYVRENNVYKFKFKKQKASKDKQYELYIKLIDTANYDKLYTVNYNKEIQKENYILSVNDRTIEGTLVFSQLYKSSNRTLLYITLNIAIFIIVVALSIYIYKKKDIKEENLFILTVPIICLMFMMTMPTFKNHDELYHWIRSYEVSTGVFATKLENGVQGTELPEAITAIIKNDWTTTTYTDVKEALEVRLDKDSTYTIDSGTASVYAFIQYIPQAIGIIIARIFTNRPLIMAYMGRIFNIIFAMLILYKAIKLMPFGKKIFLVISYIPIVIEGFSSLSPDAMTTSISFLYIAYILNIAFSDNKIVKMKEKVILTSMSVIIALCKIVYIPLVLLLFLIPSQKFYKTKENDKSLATKKLLNKQRKIKTVNILIIAGIAVIINLLWLAFSSRYLSNFRDGDSKYQILLLLKNPIEYIQKLIYTFNLNGNNYLTGMLGEALGWGELIRLRFIVPSILFILIIIELITDESIRKRFTIFQSVIMFITLLIIVGLIFTSLYVQWTTIGSDSILGVQGRYFIPILPILILLIGNVLKIKSEYKSENVAKLISITGLIISVIVILNIAIIHL